jgi:hypothetical protein
VFDVANEPYDYFDEKISCSKPQLLQVGRAHSLSALTNYELLDSREIKKQSTRLLPSEFCGDS